LTTLAVKGRKDRKGSEQLSCAARTQTGEEGGRKGGSKKDGHRARREEGVTKNAGGRKTQVPAPLPITQEPQPDASCSTYLESWDANRIQSRSKAGSGVQIRVTNKAAIGMFKQREEVGCT
jgi:hypothetical protein